VVAYVFFPALLLSVCVVAMGQSHSELRNSLDRLPSLRGKPELLKAELSQFVDVCPLDEPLPVKLDKKVFDLLHELLTSEIARSNEPSSPFDLMTIFQALQRFAKIRMFYIQLPKADLSPYVTAIKKSDPMSDIPCRPLHCCPAAAALLLMRCVLLPSACSALMSVLNCVSWMLDCKVVPEHGKEKEVSSAA
jgi:hypothetical protein